MIRQGAVWVIFEKDASEDRRPTRLECLVWQAGNDGGNKLNNTANPTEGLEVLELALQNIAISRGVYRPIDFLIDIR